MVAVSALEISRLSLQEEIDSSKTKAEGTSRLSFYRCGKH